MSYRFTENRYPQNDVNIDLNFGNDILYTDLTGDELDKYSTAYIKRNIKPYDKSVKRKIVEPSDNTKYIYVCFIVIAILIMIFWHFYSKQESNTKSLKKPVITDSRELLMVSPDVRNY